MVTFHYSLGDSVWTVTATIQPGSPGITTGSYSQAEEPTPDEVIEMHVIDASGAPVDADGLYVKRAGSNRFVELNDELYDMAIDCWHQQKLEKAA